VYIVSNKIWLLFLDLCLSITKFSPERRKSGCAWHSSWASSVVFCCRTDFWHPFSVSPSLSVFSCPFECNKAIIICHKSCSIWILLPLLGLPLILPSEISCKSQSHLKTWPIHRCFFCHAEFSRLFAYRHLLFWELLYY